MCRVAPDEIVDVVETLRQRLERQQRRPAAPRTGLDEARERLRRLQRGGHRKLLQELVDAAIAITCADMGNLQLVDPSTGSLRIVASRGFEAPFLEFFLTVADHDRSACGAALRGGEQVIVEDVASSPIFTSAAHEVMRGAGARAVQSTPLLTGAGRPIGILSTHYRSAGMTGRRLDSVMTLARWATGASSPGPPM